MKQFLRDLRSFIRNAPDMIMEIMGGNKWRY